MTNTIAFVLAIMVLLTVAADVIMGWGLVIFLFQKMGELMEWMAFWR